MIKASTKKTLHTDNVAGNLLEIVLEINSTQFRYVLLKRQ